MPKLAQYRAKRDATPVAGTDAGASILHIDMDAFFVSVELLARPELKGIAVVVGGQRDRRGVVTSASYEARRFGVHSAMALRTAAKLCPHAVFLDSHHELYGEWSDRVSTILAKYSPIVEMASIDEAYLDLAGTERLHGPALAAADLLLREITATTGLPCSGGLAATRLVAKIASEQAKPRGLVWVPSGSEAAFLAPLAVRRIPGIGKSTEASLQSLGISTVAQLQAIPLERLEESFGRWGTALYRKARGIDSYEFFIDAEPKSISHNQTFGEDTNSSELLHSALSYLCQKAAKRLRDAGLHARTVTLTLRFADFRTITRNHTLGEVSDLDTVLLGTIRDLFSHAWNGKAMLRLVGVALSSFSSGSAATEQLDLIDPGRRDKLERLARATDGLRDRYGFSKVQLGGSLSKSSGRKLPGAKSPGSKSPRAISSGAKPSERSEREEREP